MIQEFFILIFFLCLLDLVGPICNTSEKKEYCYLGKRPILLSGSALNHLLFSAVSYLFSFSIKVPLLFIILIIYGFLCPLRVNYVTNDAIFYFIFYFCFFVRHYFLAFFKINFNLCMSTLYLASLQKSIEVICLVPRKSITSSRSWIVSFVQKYPLVYKKMIPHPEYYFFFTSMIYIF